MKLSKEQIQFIDTYLIKNEVIYVDIRLEMLDHIVLAVEQKMAVENQDFYDAFHCEGPQINVVGSHRVSHNGRWI